MREILFRGKRVDNGEWITGSAINILYDFKGEKRIYIGWYEVIPETVGQWTGLTDMDGNKIFDGDVVERRFNITAFGKTSTEKLVKPVYYQLGCYQPRGLLANHESIEVIGNIHDNPELLEVEK